MLRIGFGQADITPEIGKKIGSISPRVMTGVHDPLLATACVIENGAMKIALIGVDAGVIVRSLVHSARVEASGKTGIPPENILISASHTHQGGPVFSLFNGLADPEYLTQVSRGISDAIASAWEARQPAEMGSGFGEVTGIHFNRRFLMRDGREVTHPGKMHADIVRPAGPVDPKVGVLAARARSGTILGVVVHFGCHATVTERGAEYSGDYIHYLRENLRQLTAAPVVFLLGACGDVTQINNQSPAEEWGHPWADVMGATLAGEAARTIARLSWNPDPLVRVVTHHVPISLRRDDDLEPPTLGLGSGPHWEQIYARERDHVAKMRDESPVLDCEIQAIRIGDLALVANGAELFAQPALDIQSASPLTQTWVITLANEYLGYVPTASAYYAGGYEPRTARSSFLVPDAAHKIVTASLAAITS